eukprot:TRINITY_DN10406_c0_g1_i2.p3 TRINITY_DN10406_c0_g1~~TRINITY_DN10406_c0_g1_i2.p3  ORF type:complete len:161 (+),score=26.75 TRINITY_DN10406_c0_g1_i2:2437-2919(+)
MLRVNRQNYYYKTCLPNDMLIDCPNAIACVNRQSSRNEAQTLKASMQHLKQELASEASRSLSASQATSLPPQTSTPRQPSWQPSLATLEASPSPTARIYTSSTLGSEGGRYGSNFAVTQRQPEPLTNGHHVDGLDDVEAVLAATADLLAKTKVRRDPEPN